MNRCRHYRDGPRCALKLATPEQLPAACEGCPQYLGPFRGLGDVVHTVAQATGVARVVKAVVGKDCGCHGRRQLLNRKVRFSEPAD